MHFVLDLTGINALLMLPGMGPDGALRASIVSCIGWLAHSLAIAAPLMLVVLVVRVFRGHNDFRGITSWLWTGHVRNTQTDNAKKVENSDAFDGEEEMVNLHQPAGYHDAYTTWRAYQPPPAQYGTA
jgi:hypothetical protein